jgi:uncharacterized membrane protein YccC
MSAAALLAFTLAAMLHVGNAYWAAMPVWVVAQSTRGLLLERGFFRIAGTLIGAAAGLALPLLIGDTYGQIVALGIWVAACTTLTSVLPGVRGYAALMAGMTASVVVLPSLLNPHEAAELAIARVECTLIGVVAVIVVTVFFTPPSDLVVFYRRVRKLAGDAVDFAAAAITDSADAELQEIERRVLAETSAVEASATLVSAGTIEGYRRLRHVHTLIGASIAAMAAARALRDRIARGEDLPGDFRQRLAKIAAGLRTTEAGAALAIPQVGEIHQPLGRLTQALNELAGAEAALFAASPRADISAFGQPARYLAPQRPWRRAVAGGVVSGSGLVAVSILALLSGWPAGELVALGVCIFSMVLSMMPTPRAVAPKMMIGTVVGVAAAVIYRFALQPYVTDLPLLVASVAPFIVIGAFGRASRLTALPALDANMCFMLASQAGMPAATGGQILEGSAALLLAAVLVTGGYALAPDPAQLRARASAGAIRRDLVGLIDASLREAAGEFHPRTARQLLRFMLDLQHAGRGTEAPRGLLGALNLGYAIVALKEHQGRRDLDEATRTHVAAALADLRNADTSPEEVAVRLAARARQASDQGLAATLDDAADALREAAPLLRWACGG